MVSGIRLAAVKDLGEIFSVPVILFYTGYSHFLPMSHILTT